MRGTGGAFHPRPHGAERERGTAPRLHADDLLPAVHLRRRRDRGRAAGHGARPGRTRCHRRPRRGRLPGAERTGGPRLEPGQDGVTVVRLRSGLGGSRRSSPSRPGGPCSSAAASRPSFAAFDVVNFHNVSLLGGPGLLNLGSAARSTSPTTHRLVCPTHVLWQHDREPCPARRVRFVARSATGGASALALHRLARASPRRGRRLRRTQRVQPPKARRVRLLATDGAPALLLAGRGAQLRRRSASPAPLRALRGTLERPKGSTTSWPLRGGLGVDLVIAGEGSHGRALRRLAAEALRSGSSAGFRPTSSGRSTATRWPCWRRRSASRPGGTLIKAFRAGTPVLARAVGPDPEIMERADAGFPVLERRRTAAPPRRPDRRPGAAGRLGRSSRSAFLRHWSEKAVVYFYLDIVERAQAHRRARPGALR